MESQVSHAINILYLVIACLLGFLQACIFMILKQILERIEDYIESNSNEHEAIWKRVNCHRHDATYGDVIIPHEGA